MTSSVASSVVLQSDTQVEEKKVSASDAAEAAGELLRMRQASAATYQSTDGASLSSSSSPLQVTDVGTVVSKAKRAASSLWLILHAQNCRQAGALCPHNGCSDARMILLHIKTCPAENCSDCPLQYKGCQESRKLLAHYRKCRDIRARQAGGSRRSQPHVCLVCSLVARQARNVLDGARSPSVARKITSGSRKPMAAYSLKQAPPDNKVVVPRLDPTWLKPDMPPPPPRVPNASAPIRIPKNNDSISDVPMNQCESPPSASQLMRPGLAALAAAAAPPSMTGKSTDPSFLGKSLDSSSKISFLIHASGSVVATSTSYSRRPRSESLDVTSPRKAKAIRYHEYDPTLENGLTQELLPFSIDEPIAQLARRRSASMSLLSFSSSGGSPCDTIAEELIAPEEQVFLMEEDTEL